MDRISRDYMYWQIVKTVALRSTCPRKHVGAILVKGNQIIGLGYNGSPRHTPQCDEVGCLLNAEGKCIRTVHAETNSILSAEGSQQYSTMYSSLSPCYNCCKFIINAGIIEVRYREEYRDTTGLELLRSVGIRVVHVPALDPRETYIHMKSNVEEARASLNQLLDILPKTGIK